MQRPYVSNLYIYPIKAIAGIELKRANVQRRGLEFDRRFLLVHKNKFVTQRSHPKLTLVHPKILGEKIHLSAPNMDPLQVPLEPRITDRKNVTIWSSLVSAGLVGKEFDQWFTKYLNLDVNLVYMDRDTTRAVQNPLAKPEDEVSFADGFPILITTKESLEDLNKRICDTEPISMECFRPNIVIAGTNPNEEDNWEKVKIAGTEYRTVKNCTRCIVTTISTRTASYHPKKEPLRTLSKYKTNEKAQVIFGKNAIPSQDGVIALGDEVEVLQ